jgi:hypothetical protein
MSVKIVIASLLSAVSVSAFALSPPAEEAPRSLSVEAVPVAMPATEHPAKGVSVHAPKDGYGLPLLVTPESPETKTPEGETVQAPVTQEDKGTLVGTQDAPTPLPVVK